MTDTCEDTGRRDSIAALRDIAAGYAQLADALEAHPGIPHPTAHSVGTRKVLIYAPDARAMAAAAAALPCTLAKSADDDWLNLNGWLHGLEIELYSGREGLCTRRVVGTEEREVEEVITPAVTRMVTETVEVVEWDCQPILPAGRTA